MNEQNFPQPNESASDLKNIWRIIIAIVVTAIIVGGGVYVWQKSILKSSEQSLRQQITSLENQINQLKQNSSQSILDGQPKKKTNDIVEDEKTAPNKTDDWSNYTNSKYSYSIKYPNSWFNLPNYGAPDTDKYFSNKNVGAPLEMGSDGIWITIRISDNNDNLSLSEWASKNPGNPQSEISNVRNVSINGVPAIQQVEDFTKAEGTEGGYSLATYLMKGNTVYSIKNLAFNSTTSSEYEEEYNLMAESFVITN
jgi:type II secretory pathway pseudopilin PulG